jgi:hypothetical protein
MLAHDDVMRLPIQSSAEWVMPLDAGSALLAAQPMRTRMPLSRLPIDTSSERKSMKRSNRTAGHPRDDDRKSSLAADLGADAALSLYRQRTAPRRLHGRLVVMTNFSAQRGHAVQHDESPPDDRFHRALVDNLHPPAWRNPSPADTYNLLIIGAGWFAR